MFVDPVAIGPYLVERPLGRGGMGVVYVCRHADLPRPVAVKQVLARGADGVALARFEREAELMAKIKHPSVVTVHALGRTDDGPYIVMELVDGRGLDQVARAGDVDPHVAARITRDVAAAVAVMHASGVIHRDIKPANVMLRPDGAPVLLDFGLARELAAERLTRTGEVLGTVAYMPPEQADGRSSELDGRADVYALGALLYELLAGRRPYEGGGIQVLAKVLGRHEPPPPSAVRGAARVPPGLEAIVRVAMAKDRDRRYPTAQALVADLDRFLAGAPPLALGQLRRPRARAALVSVAVLLVVVAGVLARAHGRGDAPEAAETPPTVALGAGRTTPAAAPLWLVHPDERLVYELHLVETGGSELIEFGCTLRLDQVGAQDGQRLPFACRVTRLSCRFGAPGTDGGAAYSSDAPDAGHPLAFLQAAVDQPFDCVLDARSGAVLSMGGFEAVCERVLARPRDALAALQGRPDGDRRMVGLLRTIFSDEFMRSSMAALTHVEGNDRSVAWRRSARGEPLFRARPGEPAPPVLPGLLTVFEPEDRFKCFGESRYEGGRVQRADLTQQLVDAGARSCETRWSMTRSAP